MPEHHPRAVARADHRKGVPAPGLLAQVVVAKHDDHLPLYRQQEIFARSGVQIARSSMAQWVGICGVRLAPLADALRGILAHRVIHADETPVALLAPGKGKTHRAYVWVYRTTDFVAQRGVCFDFCRGRGRGGEHPRRVLKDYSGTLVTDDYAGYKAIHARQDIIEAGCMAHARRKLFEAHDNGSTIAGHAVALIARLYEIEAKIKALGAEDRRRIRQERAKPIARQLHEWLVSHRQKVPDGSAIAKAIDYSLNHWKALSRFLLDGEVPIDNNLSKIRCGLWRRPAHSAPPR